MRGSSAILTLASTRRLANASMIPAGKLAGPMARKLALILRTIAVRLLVYGGLCLAVAWYIDGCPLALSRPSGRRPSLEEPASADPGWPHLRGPYYNA